MSWRVAKCLNQLLKELKEEFPARDVSSDGAIGNTEHQQRHSDHNPDANGVVRARDFDEDLDGEDRMGQDYYSPNMEKVVQHLVFLGGAGDSRLNPDGYVIYEDRIWSDARNWVEHPYTGKDHHEHHAHVSCGSDPTGYDRIDTWDIKWLFAEEEPIDTESTERDEEVANIFIDKSGTNPEEIYVNGALVVGVASPEDAAAFRVAGAEEVHVSHAQHDAIKAKAH